MGLFIVLLFILLVVVVITILSIAILIILFYTRVPFVRTPSRVIDEIIKTAGINEKDVVYDLGCGDAKVIVEIAKRTGARVAGYEISPWAFFLGRLRIWFTKSKAKILYKNFYKENLAPADVVFCFLIDSVMEKVGKQLETQLKPGATVISFAFHIPQWKPAQVIDPFPKKSASGRKKSSKIFIYKK